MFILPLELICQISVVVHQPRPTFRKKEIRKSRSLPLGDNLAKVLKVEIAGFSGSILVTNLHTFPVFQYQYETVLGLHLSQPIVTVLSLTITFWLISSNSVFVYPSLIYTRSSLLKNHHNLWNIKSVAHNYVWHLLTPRIPLLSIRISYSSSETVLFI